ncbi:MAG: nucleoside phosphorylase [Bacteroidetes bacterium]|nr:nucleoside phosphorylase [Bacteroidota bacterium]
MLLESELILNEDGSVYHLKLKPENLAPTVLLVGDPGRVAMISRNFDTIEHQIEKREFITHTGTLNGHRITAMSTGIGTDNIDIVMNELDAVVNVDLENRVPTKEHTSLDIIRLGTTGALQGDIPIDALILSSYGLGFDGLMNYYPFEQTVEEKNIMEAFKLTLDWTGASGAALSKLAEPYLVAASDSLKQRLGDDLIHGITATAPGFYGPQGRNIRAGLAMKDINQRLEAFQFESHRITNFEMETSAIYGFGRLLGHKTCTVCVAIANRVTGAHSPDANAAIDNMVKKILGILTEKIL